MEDQNEKAAKIIGGVFIALSAAGIVAAAALIISFFLMLRSCSAESNSENTGKKPYTHDYIEGYLEERYGRDFTFVSEAEKKLTEYDTDYIYTFEDENGIKSDVVQSYQSGYMFNGHYEVYDKYMPALLLANEDFMGEIEDSGFEYELSGDEGGSSPCICFYVKSEKETEAAAGYIYDISRKYAIAPVGDCKSYKAKWGNFYSRSLFLVVETAGKSKAESRIIAQDSPVREFEPITYNEIDKKMFITDACIAFRDPASRAAYVKPTPQTTSTEE